ncbi:GntR family transcriptional regulator [Nonomuraea recticatena]|uniref:HTH gntR-type domain-containing protein n=1 Tax=Nonomuraea recticatena TaxID=46178 RepID=A0ABP6ECJ7_9ACTN
MSGDQIDRRKPIWPQIVRELTRQIEEGELAPGDQVPGINALIEIYGISNNTAQRVTPFHPPAAGADHGMIAGPVFA